MRSRALGVLLVVFFGLTLSIPAAAQDQPNLDVTFYDSVVEIQTLPFSLITAELQHADGSRAEGFGESDEAGNGQIQFVAEGGQAPASILPGDTITILQLGQAPMVVNVPRMAVHVDAGSNSVVGEGPAGATLDLSLTAHDPTASSFQRELSTDGAGAFSADFSGELDFSATRVSGSVSMTNMDNQRFTAGFASLSAELGYDGRTIQGNLSPGWTVSGEITLPGGGNQSLAPRTVDGDGRYVLTDFSGPDSNFVSGASIALSANAPEGWDWSSALDFAISEINLAVNPEADLLEGTGPADQPIYIHADNMDGAEVARELLSDAEGNFSMDLGEVADLGPGWRIWAAYAPKTGAQVHALTVLPKVRVGVGMPTFQGRSRPDSGITVTLKSSAGETKLQTRSRVDGDGEYLGFLGFNNPPMSGDILELEFDFLVGDPMVIPVPQLGAVTDSDASAVRGNAPANSMLRVEVLSSDPPMEINATSDDLGEYNAVLGPSADLGPGSYGRVYLDDGGSREFYTSWAAFQLNVTPGDINNGPFIAGVGPAGRLAQFQLLAPDGSLIEESETQIFDPSVFGIEGFDGGPQFFTSFQDVTGTPVQMRPGDRVRVSAGGQELEVTVPPLDTVVFVQADRISGRTAPNAKITMRLADLPINVELEVQTDADDQGNFGYDFSGQRGIKHGDFIQLSAEIEGHTFNKTVIAPGLLLDMDAAGLLGSVAPNLNVRITVQRGSETISDLSTQSGADGEIAVGITDSSGAPLEFMVGDVLRATPSDPTQDPLEIVIPDMDLNWDQSADSVGGSAPPEGSLTMLATYAYPVAGTLGIGLAWPIMDASGDFEAQIVPHLEVRPGSRYFAIYRPSQGHYVVRTRTVPILNGEHGGPNVCGFGMPRQDLSLNLRDASNADLAALGLPARFDGYFSGVWRNPAGEIIRTASGQSIAGDLAEPGVNAALDLAALNIDVNWENDIISGTGPADSTFYLSAAIPCPNQQNTGIFNVGVPFAQTGTTDAEGNINFGIPVPNQPGFGVEIAFYDETGKHRFFHQQYLAQAWIYIRSNRVAGRSNALDPITLQLKSEGQVQAEVNAEADTSGLFDLRLETGAGEPAIIEAGDVISLQSVGGPQEITVEPLSFDWSDGSPIFGSAPPGKTVQLFIRLADGRVFRIEREADDAGDFGFTEAEIPPRGGWALDDIRAVRVQFLTEDGHSIIDQTPNWEGPPVRENDGRLFLPAAMRNAGLGSEGTILAEPSRSDIARSATTLQHEAPGLNMNLQFQPSLDQLSPEPMVLDGGGTVSWLNVMGLGSESAQDFGVAWKENQVHPGWPAGPERMGWPRTGSFWTEPALGETSALEWSFPPAR